MTCLNLQKLLNQHNFFNSSPHLHRDSQKTNIARHLLVTGSHQTKIVSQQTLTGSQKTNIARHLLIIGSHQTKIGSQKTLTGSHKTNIARHLLIIGSHQRKLAAKKRSLVVKK